MPKWIRCALRGCIVGTIITGGLLASLGCHKDAANGAAAPSMPPPLVNVATAQGKDVPLYLDEIGKAQASEMVTVMPQVAGRVEALHFADGADLKVGQPLFTIDARPFTALVHQAEAQLEKDQAAQVNAEKYLKRQEDIFKQGILAPSDYDTATFNAKSAKGTVEADQAAIESAKLNLDYCTIKSPIDGRAGMRLVDPGNVVKINETPMLVIQRIDPIYADFTINERDLADVRAHMADHSLEAFIRLPTDIDQGRTGTLTFLDNAVQDSSGTIKLRATLANADRHFWPGEFVKVRLILQVLKDAVLIPSSALQLSQQGPYVFVVKADGTSELRNVVLGQEQGDLVVIKSGVKAGQSVITNGQLLVFPGGKVNVQPAAASGAPAPAQKSDEVEPATEPAATQPTTAPATQPVAIANVGSALADARDARSIRAIHLRDKGTLAASAEADPTQFLNDLVFAPSPLYSGERAGVRGDVSSCVTFSEYTLVGQFQSDNYRQMAPHPNSLPQVFVGWAYSPAKLLPPRKTERWASTPTLHETNSRCAAMQPVSTWLAATRSGALGLVTKVPQGEQESLRFASRLTEVLEHGSAS